jgi:hypothetical protein
MCRLPAVMPAGVPLVDRRDDRRAPLRRAERALVDPVVVKVVGEGRVVVRVDGEDVAVEQGDDGPLVLKALGV